MVSNVADPPRQVSAVPPGDGLFSGILGLQPAVPLVCLLVWALTNMDQGLFGFVIPGILAEFHLPLSVIGTVLTVSFCDTGDLRRHRR